MALLGAHARGCCCLSDAATTPAGKTLVDKPKPATSSAAAAAAEGGAKEGDAAPIPEKLKLPLDKFRQAADVSHCPKLTHAASGFVV